MAATSILDRFLDPITDILPPETARRLIDLRLAPDDERRIDELAQKANRGQLSNEEREEYGKIVEGLDIIAIIKAKARAALQRRAS